MGRGGGQPDHVEQRAAAHPDHVGVAVNMVAINLRMNLRNVKIGVLRALAALDDDGRADQGQGIGVRGEIIFDPARQPRLGLRQRFVQDEKHFVRTNGFGAAQGRSQDQVGRIERGLSEINSQPVADLDGSLDEGHQAEFAGGTGDWRA